MLPQRGQTQPEDPPMFTASRNTGATLDRPPL